MADISGTNLGPYELKTRLGQGGMGTVYRGYQASMDRDVAIKVLPAALALDPEFIARFRREARTIANLGHARILPVHDYGEQDGTAYLVMRYLDGSTLHERVERDGPLSPEQAARIVRQVAEGLGYAHAQGIIHRDMTANNIMFDSVGDAYITDFGLAKIMEGAAQLTGSGILGTPAYMSPEQALGDQVDHRCDIYALGVVLFEMLTGEVPYQGSSAMVIVVKHINEPLPDPRDLRPDLPHEVVQVVFKATAKDPNDRFQTCGEFADALDAAIKGNRSSASIPRMQPAAVNEGTRKLSPTSPVKSQETASEPSGLPVWVIPVTVIAALAVLGVIYLLVIAPRMQQTSVAPTPTLFQFPTSASEATSVSETTSTPEPAPPSTNPPPPQADTPLPPAPTGGEAQGGQPPQGGGQGQAQGGGQGGPPQPLAANPAVLSCPDSRSLVLGHDFSDTRPEGMQIFVMKSDYMTLQGDALVIRPMPQGISAPVLTGPAMINTYVWMRAGWVEGPGIVAVEINFDLQSTNSYVLVIDGPARVIRIDKNRAQLAQGPLNANPFDGQKHELAFAMLDKTLSVTIDNQTVFSADDPAPLPAGLVHLHSGVTTLGIDALGICGNR